LAAFIQYQILALSVKEADDSVVPVQAKHREGIVDFNRVFPTQAQLVTQQDALASCSGNIAASLIAVYRALGGWDGVAFAGGPAPAQ
jgi:outer membrane protein TolC